MESRREPRPQGAGDSENTNSKIEEDDSRTPDHSVQRMDVGSELEDGRQAGRGPVQAEGGGGGGGAPSPPSLSE